MELENNNNILYAENINLKNKLYQQSKLLDQLQELILLNK